MIIIIKCDFYFWNQ